MFMCPAEYTLNSTTCGPVCFPLRDDVPLGACPSTTSVPHSTRCGLRCLSVADRLFVISFNDGVVDGLSEMDQIIIGFCVWLGVSVLVDWWFHAQQDGRCPTWLRVFPSQLALREVLMLTRKSMFGLAFLLTYIYVLIAQSSILSHRTSVISQVWVALLIQTGTFFMMTVVIYFVNWRVDTLTRQTHDLRHSSYVTLFEKGLERIREMEVVLQPTSSSPAQEDKGLLCANDILARLAKEDGVEPSYILPDEQDLSDHDTKEDDLVESDQSQKTLSTLPRSMFDWSTRLPWWVRLTRAGPSWRTLDVMTMVSLGFIVRGTLHSRRLQFYVITLLLCHSLAAPVLQMMDSFPRVRVSSSRLSIQTWIRVATVWLCVLFIIVPISLHLLLILAGVDPETSLVSSLIFIIVDCIFVGQGIVLVCQLQDVKRTILHAQRLQNALIANPPCYG